MTFRGFLGHIAIVASCVLAPGTVGTVAAQENGVVARYASALGTANGALSLATRQELAERLLLLSTYYQVDPRLLLAIVATESNWHAGAVSPVGALGYGQLMPATAADLHVEPLDPYENLDGTARYLRRMIERYATFAPDERIRRAVASYNAGPYAVSHYGGVPPYRETQRYVATVIAAWHRYASILSDPSVATVTALMVGHAASQKPTSPRKARLMAREPSPAATAAHPYDDVAHFTELDVQSLRSPPAPVVRYETSRSFVARLFGMKHRVVQGSPSAATAPR